MIRIARHHAIAEAHHADVIKDIVMRWPFNIWSAPQMSSATEDKFFNLAKAKGVEVQIHKPVGKKSGSVIIEYKDGKATSIGFKTQSERAGALRSGIAVLEKL